VARGASSGDTRSEPCIKELWACRAAEEVRRYLLLPVETPAEASRAARPPVCNCFNVSEREIEDFLARSNSHRHAPGEPQVRHELRAPACRS